MHPNHVNNDEDNDFNGFSQFQEQPQLGTHSEIPEGFPDDIREGLPDPVHGEMILPIELEPLLFTDAVQRLKGLKQLGAASLVYHTAEHNRFQHCCGVAWYSLQFAKHISNSIAEQLVGAVHLGQFKASRSELVQVAAAGLCHDLGHGPFSHLWERFLERVRPNDHWSHEDMSAKLVDTAVAQAVQLCNLPPDHFLRDKDNIKAVKCMIAGDTSVATPEKAWLYTIVNNRLSGLDTDKLDYLVRDQHFIFRGDSRLGHLDLDEIKRNAFLCKTEEPEGDDGPGYEIAFKLTRQSYSTVAKVFQTRAEMHNNVYQRGPVLAAEEAIIALLELLDPVFKWSELSMDPESFVKMHDGILDVVRSAEPHKYGEPELAERLKRGQSMLLDLRHGLGLQHIICRSLPRHHGLCKQKLEREMDAAVVAPVRAKCEHHGIDARLKVKVTEISEGQEDEAAVEGVLFVGADHALRRQRGCRREQLEHSSRHTQVSSCRKFFFHVLADKRTHTHEWLHWKGLLHDWLNAQFDWWQRSSKTDSAKSSGADRSGPGSGARTDAGVDAELSSRAIADCLGLDVDRKESLGVSVQMVRRGQGAQVLATRPAGDFEICAPHGVLADELPARQACMVHSWIEPHGSSTLHSGSFRTVPLKHSSGTQGRPAAPAPATLVRKRMEGGVAISADQKRPKLSVPRAGREVVADTDTSSSEQ